MKELIKINEDGKITARELYDFLQLTAGSFSRWAKTNIEENEFYQEGVDWWGFSIMLNGNETKDYLLTIEFAKHLCMLSRSEKGKQARSYFVEIERRFQEPQPLPQMTPVQILAAITKQMADQEQMMLSAAANASTALRQVEFITETIVKRDDAMWRESTNIDINAIAKTSGKPFRDVKSEIYGLLESRANCDLNTRLRNARDRAREQGLTKTAIDSINKLDMIEQDSRLREIYIAIVKEMAIRYLTRGK